MVPPCMQMSREPAFNGHDVPLLPVVTLCMLLCYFCYTYCSLIKSSITSLHKDSKAASENAARQPLPQPTSGGRSRGRQQQADSCSAGADWVHGWHALAQQTCVIGAGVMPWCMLPPSTPRSTFTGSATSDIGGQTSAAFLQTSSHVHLPATTLYESAAASTAAPQVLAPWTSYCNSLLAAGLHVAAAAWLLAVLVLPLLLIATGMHRRRAQKSFGIKALAAKRAFAATAGGAACAAAKCMVNLVWWLWCMVKPAGQFIMRVESSPWQMLPEWARALCFCTTACNGYVRHSWQQQRKRQQQHQHQQHQHQQYQQSDQQQQPRAMNAIHVSNSSSPLQALQPLQPQLQLLTQQQQPSGQLLPGGSQNQHTAPDQARMGKNRQKQPATMTTPFQGGRRQLSVPHASRQPHLSQDVYRSTLRTEASTHAPPGGATGVSLDGTPDDSSGSRRHLVWDQSPAHAPSHLAPSRGCASGRLPLVAWVLQPRMADGSVGLPAQDTRSSSARELPVAPLAARTTQAEAAARPPAAARQSIAQGQQQCSEGAVSVSLAEAAAEGRSRLCILCGRGRPETMLQHAGVQTCHTACIQCSKRFTVGERCVYVSMSLAREVAACMDAVMMPCFLGSLMSTLIMSGLQLLAQGAYSHIVHGELLSVLRQQS